MLIYLNRSELKLVPINLQSQFKTYFNSLMLTVYLCVKWKYENPSINSRSLSITSTSVGRLFCRDYAAPKVSYITETFVMFTKV